MNKQRMLRLADRLEKIDPNKFDMNAFADKRECGTTCCVAGHALLMAGWKLGEADVWEAVAFVSRRGVEVHTSQVGDYAQEYLGLTEPQAKKLFYSGWKRTNKDAARIIRNMVKNGK